MGQLLFSNFRFLQSYYWLNILKIISNVIGFIFFLTFWFIQSDSTQFMSVNAFEKKNIFLLAIIAVTCGSYLLIQLQTLNLRKKEIFIRKWYGAKSVDLFWIFFLEHLTILLLSVIFSLVAFDFIRSFVNNITEITLQQGYFSLIIPVLVNTIFILISGSFLVFFFVYKK